MTFWTTEIRAISPVDGELKLYAGPHIKAFTKGMAQQYCEENGLGYCKVTDQLISEIPTKEDGYAPDWDKEVDYNTHNNN